MEFRSAWKRPRIGLHIGHRESKLPVVVLDLQNTRAPGYHETLLQQIAKRELEIARLILKNSAFNKFSFFYSRNCSILFETLDIKYMSKP